jgi:hypothetical protein
LSHSLYGYVPTASGIASASPARVTTWSALVFFTELSMPLRADMRRFVVLSVFFLGGAQLLTGCGTYVPEIVELPGQDSYLLVTAIVQSVHCEIANAVKNTIDDAAQGSTVSGRSSAEWLKHWGAQVTLTLTLEEKTTINPTGVLTPVGPLTTIFTLAGSLLGSADATRTDAVNFYYTVPDLYKQAPCHTGIQPKDGATSLLIQSDLKLQEWLQDQILPSAAGTITLPTSPNGPLGKNVISHEVKFQVVTTGGITPAWKLVQVNFNQSGTLFEVSRLRTHDLQITLGPGDFKGLTTFAANNAHLASQIGLAVSTNLTPLSTNLRLGLPF